MIGAQSSAAVLGVERPAETTGSAESAGHMSRLRSLRDGESPSHTAVLREGTRIMAHTCPGSRRLRLTLTVPTGWNTVAPHDLPLLGALGLIVRLDSLTTSQTDREREFAEVGMHLATDMGPDSTTFTLTAPVGPVQPTAELLLDMAFLPAFRTDQLLEHARDLADVFGSRSIGSAESEMLCEAHQRLYRPEASLLVASGPGSAQRMVNDLSGAVRAVLSIR